MRKLFNEETLKPMALLMSLAMLFMSFTYPAVTGKTVVLKSGTNIPLELMDQITSDSVSNGQMINFRVVSDVKASGEVVIKAGSIAQGQITSVKKNALFGQPGKITVSIRSVKAVDGTSIPLTYGSLNGEGDNKLAVSLIVTVFCLLGFLIKGGDAEIAAGTQCYGMVVSDVEINL